MEHLDTMVTRRGGGSAWSIVGRASASLSSMGIAGAFAVVALVVINTGGTRTVAPHLFYLPIIVAAYLYGPRGAALAALAAGVLFCGPLMPLDTRGWIEQSTIGWTLRTVSFLAVGALTGVLVNRLDAKAEEMNDYNAQTIRAFVHTIDAKSNYTALHSESVARYAVAIARELGLTSQDCNRIKWIGLLHDIGKIAMPDSILDKPGRLTDEEWEIVKRHPLDSVKILQEVSRYKAYLPGVRQHHERVDGKGYPDGVSGDDFSLDGRIVAVADAYDAMTSARPYRPALSPAQAFEELGRGAGTQFDPLVVEAAARAL